MAVARVATLAGLDSPHGRKVFGKVSGANQTGQFGRGALVCISHFLVGGVCRGAC